MRCVRVQIERSVVGSAMYNTYIPSTAAVLVQTVCCCQTAGRTAILCYAIELLGEYECMSYVHVCGFL